MKKTNNTQKSLLILLLTALLTALFVNYVSAFPALPSQFYGKIAIDGKNAEYGANISAYYSDGVLCGTTVIEKNGKYILSCRGDDLATIEEEGAKENALIIFYVNNKSTESNAKWHEGEFIRLDFALETKNDTISPITEYPSEQRISMYNYLLIAILSGIIVFCIIKIAKNQER